MANYLGKEYEEMKRFLRLVLPVLMGAIIFTPDMYGRDITNITTLTMPTGDLAIREPSQPMELLSAEEVEELNNKMAAYAPIEVDLLVNAAKTFYYYENLDPVAKEIYDVLYGVAEDPTNPGNVGLMITDLDPQGDEYYYEFNLAYRAICFDHPELFWLYSGEKANIGYYSEAVNMGGFYFVYIMMIEPYDEFEEVMIRFNSAATNFLADIDTGISEFETVRQIHDKLIDLVDYNDPVAEHTSVSLVHGLDLAHTAYGALVSDSTGNPNYAVCDGYSLAFEYLLQQCGIEVIFIGGNAGLNEQLAEGHAWNMVRIDNTWYEVDSTWDDAGSMIDDITPLDEGYDYFMEALSDPIYREKIDHFLFLVSTDRIRHFLPGDEYDYITHDQMYVFQLRQESVHIRLSDSGSMYDYDPAVIALAPIAMQSYQ